MKLSSAKKVCFGGKEVRNVIDTKTGKVLYRKKQETEILCFTAENDGGGTVTLTKKESGSSQLNARFKISYNAETWQSYVVGTPITLSKRQHVYFSAED